MTAPEHVRVFGRRVRDVVYVKRPSVYAVIRNDAREIAVVHTAQGVFLPGGGIESGETPEVALHREVREECGFAVRLLAELPSALQLVYSPAELTYFEKSSSFFVAAVVGGAEVLQDEGCRVLWVTRERAISILAHESHQWACSISAERASP